MRTHGHNFIRGMVAGVFITAVVGMPVVYAPDHGSGHHQMVRCIASMVRQAPCPDEASSFATLQYHVSVYKVIGMAVLASLLALSVIWAWFEATRTILELTTVSRRWATGVPLDFRSSRPWIVWRRFYRWLAVLRQREAAVAA